MTRAWICSLLGAPALAAADTTPLSALPAKPVSYGQASGAVPVTVTLSGSDREVRGTGSTCLVYDPPKYWIDGDATLEGRYSDLQTSDRTPFGIERLVTRGDAAELERITASFIYGELVQISRSRIALHAVATLEGLAVYAYRWDAKVFLVTRSSGTAMLRHDGGPGLEEVRGCGVVYTMLRVRNGSSQIAQIRGTVPGTGRRYLVDASVAQTGRDPEPLLSVTARLLDR